MFDEIWDEESLLLDLEGWPTHYDGSLDLIKIAKKYARCSCCGSFTTRWSVIKMYKLGVLDEKVTLCPVCFQGLAKKIADIRMKPFSVVVVTSDA